MTTIEHRDLRSALEYAVLIAAEGQKRRPPLAFPKELKPFLGQSRIAQNSLGRIRRAVEADPSYRAAITAGVSSDLVDEVGRLWLVGRRGWEEEAAKILAARQAEEESSDLRRDVKRAEKRRIAAEQAAARVQADVVQRDSTIAKQAAELDDLRADVAKAAEALEEMRAELIDTRNEARHARDREAAALERVDLLERRLTAASEAVPRVDVGDGTPDHEALVETERRLAEVVEASREFVEKLESLTAPAPSAADEPGRLERASRRRPLRLPGGLISTSAAAARHLVTQGAPIIVDGYNVSKLAWPDRSLEQQRDALVARCENLARRHLARVTVVFDGDSVPGAHATVRRSIRVVYSPAGTSADDVIRAEVDLLADDSPVVVVTSDRQIVDDVKLVGANVIASNAFIAVL